MGEKDLLVSWLNDAYSNEKALEEVLERHATDAEGHAEVKARIQGHLDETRRHADVVKGCIEEMGGSVSGAKAALANMLGAVQGMLNRPFQDTLVKNALADYAAEHFEIASYRALIDAAQQLGEPQVVAKLEQILNDEQEMARWLEQQLPSAVKETLAHAGG